ncbi:hypothetical protein BJ912DRAFT_578328 [Pholiota molesta]|nr:hypothetical protein BJ912DRAFT_578328 [Pholiota molesta]
MSEFLHLFTMVEFYRLKITERASTLIAWDTFYGGQEDSSFSLTAGQRKICERIEDAGKDYRKIYLIVISHCCIVDLKRLWLANSNTDFWIRWNEYFSILKGGNSETISHTFHYKMTHKEHSVLHEAAYEVSEFMEATVRWMAGNQSARGQSIQDVFKSNVFQENFPTPELSSDVLDLIDYQLKSVQDAVHRVGTIKSQRD